LRLNEQIYLFFRQIERLSGKNDWFFRNGYGLKRDGEMGGVPAMRENVRDDWARRGVWRFDCRFDAVYLPKAG
jgi:hypothetical protein